MVNLNPARRFVDVVVQSGRNDGFSGRAVAEKKDKSNNTNTGFGAYYPQRAARSAAGAKDPISASEKACTL
jgi:hypothetical protein